MNSNHSNPRPDCNIELARQMERAEGMANADFVEAHRQAFPDSGACWIDVAGTFAMYDGPDSPCTQTFGLGMSAPVAERDFEELESFFFERNAPVHHEVCPMIDSQTLQFLNDRGYRPIEFSNVLYQPIENSKTPGGRVNQSSMAVRAVNGDEHGLWARVAAAGWADVAPGLDEYLDSLSLINPHRKNCRCYLVELKGEAIAAGALNIENQVALLAGACTVPDYRRRGAQNALLQHRLDDAADRGCTLAVMVAEPGSASQRNAERQGFRVAYTRTKWQLKQSG